MNISSAVCRSIWEFPGWLLSIERRLLNQGEWAGVAWIFDNPLPIIVCFFGESIICYFYRLYLNFVRIPVVDLSV